VTAARPEQAVVPHIRVVRGGPDAEEIAALTVALLLIARRAARTERPPAEDRPAPGWARCGRPHAAPGSWRHPPPRWRELPAAGIPAVPQREVP
jgi:Acyl-CoA carboxylase epsilon subunit